MALCKIMLFAGKKERYKQFSKRLLCSFKERKTNRLELNAGKEIESFSLFLLEDSSSGKCSMLLTHSSTCSLDTTFIFLSRSVSVALHKHTAYFKVIEAP